MHTLNPRAVRQKQKVTGDPVSRGYDREWKSRGRGEGKVEGWRERGRKIFFSSTGDDILTLERL